MSQLRARYTQRRLVRLKITDVHVSREPVSAPIPYSPGHALGFSLLSAMLLGALRRRR